MTAGVELLSTPEPHLPPGYSGYLPQYRFNCGGTYGSLSHKLLLDPSVDHSSVLIVSSPHPEDYEVTRPPSSDIRIVNTRYKRTDPLWIHALMPGYDGFIPRIQSLSGQRYGVLATEALADFERQQLKHRNDLINYKQRLFLQDESKIAQKSSTKAGDFECRCFDSTEAPIRISPECDSKVFSKMLETIGWPSETKARPEAPLAVQPTGIYQKHTGLIPNYLGHVPGSAFQIGKTFGAATKDAKRWLV